MTDIPFLFSEEHDAFRDSVRRLAETEFGGGYLARATTENIRQQTKVWVCWVRLLSISTLTSAIVTDVWS